MPDDPRWDHKTANLADLYAGGCSLRARQGIIQSMRDRVIVFAFFAAAMLFSITREWSAPIGCPRLTVNRQISRR